MLAIKEHQISNRGNRHYSCKRTGQRATKESRSTGCTLRIVRGAQFSRRAAFCPTGNSSSSGVRRPPMGRALFQKQKLHSPAVWEDLETIRVGHPPTCAFSKPSKPGPIPKLNLVAPLREVARSPPPPVNPSPTQSDANWAEPMESVSNRLRRWRP